MLTLKCVVVNFHSCRCTMFPMNLIRNGSVGRKEGHIISIGTGFRRH